MAGLAEEGERAQGLSQSRRRRRRDAGAGKVKVDGEYRHAERAERHRARRNLALQQAVAADRPDADADQHSMAFSGTLVASGKARSEEHTSELQSLMRISYAVFCLKKK